MEVSRKKQAITFFFSQNGAKHTHFKKPWFGSDFSIRRIVSVGSSVHFWDWVHSEDFLQTQVRGGGRGWGSSLWMLWRAAARDDPKALGKELVQGTEALAVHRYLISHKTG